VPFVVLFQFLLVSALWDFIENKSIRSSK